MALRGLNWASGSCRWPPTVCLTTCGSSADPLLATRFTASVNQSTSANAVFERVADPFDSVGQGFHYVALLDVLRGQQDADGWTLAPDDLGGLEPVVDVRWRHADVDDRDARLR